MSTSDPHTLSGEPDPTLDTTSSLHATRGAAARAAAAHAAERPTPTPPPAFETGAEHAPTASADVPAHAPAPAEVREATSPGPTATSPGTRYVGPAPAHVERSDAAPAHTDRSEPAPEPVAPRSTGFGGHVWGVLVGLLVAPAAIVVTLVGQSRILAVQFGGLDASIDVLGIVLMSVGALLLAGLVYLGVWSAAVPTTGGILATAVGAMFLFAPGLARDETIRWLATDSSRQTVSQSTVSGTSGLILLAGLLLLAAGLATSLAKRRGRVLGAFRERGRAA